MSVIQTSNQARYVEFSAPGVVELRHEELSAEPLGAWDVVIRNEASLISPGTELSFLHAHEVGIEFPRRSGYASVGVIEQKGEAVDDFQVGDRIFYAGKHASRQRFTHGQNHQWGRLYPVPQNLAPADAVYGCLAEIALSAPAVTQLSPGDTVAVFGLGLVGNLAAQIYQIMGARVLAFDPVASRGEVAKRSGLRHVFCDEAAHQAAVIKDLTDGRGADVTVDATGHSAVIEKAVEATALFGQVILLGTPRLPYESNLTKTLRLIHDKGLVMRGAHQWRFPPTQIREVKHTVPWAFRTVFDWINCGQLQVAPLRSHLAKPEQAAQMYDGLKNDPANYWGVVFNWTQS